MEVIPIAAKTMNWNCANCGTSIGSEFKVCWNCGTDIDGNLDESFAVDSDPEELLEDPETPRIHCLNCGYQGKVHFSTEHKSGFDWIVAGLVSMLVSQRSWIHFCHRLCPQCGSQQDRHRAWSGEISDSNEATWEQAVNLEASRTRAYRRLFYLVFFCILAAGLILWWALNA